MGEIGYIEDGPVLQSVLNPESGVTAKVSETPEVVPLSGRLMAEFLSAYKGTEAFAEANKRYNAFQPTPDMPKMQLEIAYAAHPEGIYADMRNYVDDTLNTNRSIANYRLALTLLKDSRPNAVDIFPAWRPLGENYGNAILAVLIEENLVKRRITREQFISNLQKAIEEELRRTRK